MTKKEALNKLRQIREDLKEILNDEEVVEILNDKQYDGLDEARAIIIKVIVEARWEVE